MPTFLLGPWGEKWVSYSQRVRLSSRPGKGKASRRGSRRNVTIACYRRLLRTMSIPNESSDSYRERLHKAWITKRWSGTDIGILRGLETLYWAVNRRLVDILDRPTDWGAPNTAWFRAARDFSESTPDGDLPTPKWARFWIVLDWYLRAEPMGRTRQASLTRP